MEQARQGASAAKTAADIDASVRSFRWVETVSIGLSSLDLRAADDDATDHPDRGIGSEGS